MQSVYIWILSIWYLVILHFPQQTNNVKENLTFLCTFVRVWDEWWSIFNYSHSCNQNALKIYHFLFILHFNLKNYGDPQSPIFFSEPTSSRTQDPLVRICFIQVELYSEPEDKILFHTNEILRRKYLVSDELLLIIS